jgi:uncharacterized protein YndB with AHSA1/START domain
MTTTLTFSRHVKAPAAEVFRAFVHPTALRDWLCQTAQTEARLGGRVCLWWDQGEVVVGAFTHFDPARRLALTWHGQADPGPSEVVVALTGSSAGTRLVLTHRGLGHGPAWRATRQALRALWRAALEALDLMVRAGLDLRRIRRPRLGIGYGEFNADIARKLGVPVDQGIKLESIAPGTGAEAAGLQRNDVLIRFNGHPLVGEASFGPALAGLKAGDTTEVVFYRGAQERRAQLTLGSFPIPKRPMTGIRLAAELRPIYRRINRDLAQLVKGLSEAEAERAPARGAWHVKHLIAHLILMERDQQSWVADMLRDNAVEDSLLFRPNMTPRLDALITRLTTVRALQRELAAAQAETARLVETLPAEFVRRRKHLYLRLAEWLLDYTPAHFYEEHGNQFARTITKAKGR